jgi:synaptobrevin family protein YKT6
MKLSAISIQKFNGADKDATSLGLAADVASYGYFQRGPVTQMMAFVARTVAQRTQPGQRQSVQQVFPIEDRYKSWLLSDTLRRVLSHA